MGADQRGVPGCDWRSNTNPKCNSDSNSYSNGNSDCNANRDSYSNGNNNRDSNGYCYSHCNTYSYANGYCKCYSYTHAQTVANGTAWTIDQAASNPGAAAIA